MSLYEKDKIKKIFFLPALLLISLTLFLLVKQLSDFNPIPFSAEIVSHKNYKDSLETEPSSYEINLKSEPEHANYTLSLPNGEKKKGKTPFSEKISGGEIKIELSLPGYKTVEKKLVVSGDYSNKFYLDFSKQIVDHLLNINSVPSPKGAKFTPDGKELWVTMLLNEARGVGIFHPLTGKNSDNINLDDGGGVEVIFSKDGSKAYISQMETGRVFEVDTENKEILRIFDTKSTWTKVLKLDPKERKLYASNWSGNEISVIDLDKGETVEKIPAVDTPRGIYITENQKLYVAGFRSGEIQKINLETKKSEVIFRSGGAMRHIAGDEEKGILYASDMAKGVIWKVSLEDDRVTKFVETDTNPNTIILGPENKILFVSCRGKNASPNNYYVPGPEWGSILLFDTESGEMLDAIVGGNQPTALDFSPQDRLLVFSNFLDSQLEVYKVPSYETLKQGEGGRSKSYKKELRK